MGGKAGGIATTLASATPQGMAVSAATEALGALSGQSTVGDTQSGSTGSTFGPISIGGFKSDGTAGFGGLPNWVLPVVLGGAALAVLALIIKK